MCSQPDQIKRQHKNFVAYEIVRQKVSTHLLQATTRMMLNEREMRAAVSYGVLKIDTVWGGYLRPLLPLIATNEIDRVKATLGDQEEAHWQLTTDGAVAEELAAFTANCLMPEYIEVWRVLKHRETQILENFSGDHALDDLELEFQARRLRIALDGECVRHWRTTAFGRSFAEPVDETFRAGLEEVKELAASEYDEDLPPLMRNSLESDESSPGRDVWLRLSLRIFEEGIHTWYIQNLALHGQFVFLSQTETEGELRTAQLFTQAIFPRSLEVELLTDLQASTSFEQMDAQAREFYTQAGNEDQASSEHFATILYIVGAAMQRLGKFCDLQVRFV